MRPIIELSLVVTLATLGALGCGDSETAASGQVDAAVTDDGGVLLDDAGNPILEDAGSPLLDDAGNPIVPDGSTPAGDGGSSPQDDAGPSSPGFVECGDTACDVSTQECCLSYDGATCIDIGDPCLGRTMTCDSPDDCAPEEPVCCARLFSMNEGPSCSLEEDCQTMAYQLCHVDADCGDGEKCCGSGDIAGLSLSWCEDEADCPNTEPTTGIPCGDDDCTPPEVCCVRMTSQSCTDAGSCQGTALGCDGPEDCSGDTPVCCGAFGFSMDRGSQCVATDTCTSGQTSGIVCHDDPDCPDDTTCTTLQLVDIRICR